MSLTVRTCWCLLFIYLSLLSLTASTDNPLSVCSKTTFTTKYLANLNTIFSSFNSTSNSTRFSAATAGNGTRDAVYGLYLCLAEMKLYECHDCVSTATTADLTKVTCFIFNGNCTVKYSNEPILGKLDMIRKMSFVNRKIISGNQTLFAEVVRDLLNSLTVEVSKSVSKFGTKQVNFTSTQPVYSRAFCTPDMSSKDCELCLKTAIGMLLTTRQGIQILLGSCSLYYYIYPFYIGAITYTTPLPSNSITNTTSLITPGKKRSKHRTWIIVVILLLVFILLPTLILSYVRRKRKLRKEIEGNEDQMKCVDSLQFDFKTIQVATDNFSDTRRTGKGNSAVVFKGVLSTGQEVAVKRLYKLSRDGEAKFNNEVLLSANLQHRNLVKFVGFYVEKAQRFLIHEFVPNGSLDSYLSDACPADPVKHKQLDWETRSKIIHGIARGLLYMHEDSHVRVIHRDLKSSNILLSVGMNPKISNFCKASLVHDVGHTRGDASTAKGTFGYMPPEYALKGQFSPKSDVFSFGVILLEIISGQRISEFWNEENKDSLPIFAWRKWSEGKATEIVDQKMSNVYNHSEQITRCIKIALLCVQENPSYRPKMSNVVLMLNSDTVPIPEPSQPGFMVHDELHQYYKHDSSQIDISQRGSVTEVSMSYFEPR